MCIGDPRAAYLVSETLQFSAAVPALTLWSAQWPESAAGGGDAFCVLSRVICQKARHSSVLFFSVTVLEI